MEVVFLVFPHQLFENPAIPKEYRVLLVEDELFFSQYPFHKQKITLHRASMTYYADYLKGHGYQVDYLESKDFQSAQRTIEDLREQGVQKVACFAFEDDYLSKRYRKACTQLGLDLEVRPSPNFMATLNEAEELLQKKKGYFLHDFYIRQRKKYGLLLDEQGGPLGGKWSYDPENRKKLPRKHQTPKVRHFDSKWLKPAKTYVETHFPDHSGEVEGFCWPLTHAQAREALEDFLQHRLVNYGTYQDAMRPGAHYLYHSLLTAALNIGLLDPGYILERTMEVYKAQDLELNQVEGFIRQILGWREFMRAVYQLEGRNMRSRNFFGFSRPIPSSFWEGNTGIVPVDDAIEKLLKTGYNHHIERLMILGNFMLLCEFDPNQVYEWFMTFYIDAYDWVMVPNVYGMSQYADGMSQYADGGLITTKPYISSSNYIRKMSNYPKGDWQETWDGLYWRFLYRYGERFKANPRMKMQLALLKKMDKPKLDRHLKVAEGFLDQF